MNIIKLNAIDSTNSYIKKLTFENQIENYTIVVAEHQTDGRGQMGTVWLSEQGKNLTFSVLVRFNNFKIERQFYLSMAVSLGVYTALSSNVKNSLFIKWPNDILAEKFKVAGILIENILRGNSIKQSIVGIGLNVNQEIFLKNIGNVTSLKCLSGRNFDKEEILLQVVEAIQHFCKYVVDERFEELKELYLNALYKFNSPVMFEDTYGLIFMGKIIDVDENGKLVVELENETTRKFSLKEIKFANC